MINVSPITMRTTRNIMRIANIMRTTRNTMKTANTMRIADITATDAMMKAAVVTDVMIAATVMTDAMIAAEMTDVPVMSWLK